MATDLLYQHAKFGGDRMSHASTSEESSSFVCLLFIVQDERELSCRTSKLKKWITAVYFAQQNDFTPILLMSHCLQSNAFVIDFLHFISDNQKT